jgi:HlyD family secretion protein
VADYELEQARAILLRSQPGDTPTPEVLNITSPVSGRILRVMQESARTLPAGTPLLEVGDPTDLEVRIEVLSRDGVAIPAGANVFLDQWGGAKPLEARVRLVEPSAFTKISALGVEEQRVYVIADFTDPVETRPTLGDGYRVEARIVRWSADNVLRVPSGALFQREGQWQTFVIEGSRAQLRSVTIGQSNGLETEILSGLTEGTRVVIYPGDRVIDGSRVRPLTVEK